jgi:hypothetical protein
MPSFYYNYPNTLPERVTLPLATLGITSSMTSGITSDSNTSITLYDFQYLKVHYPLPQLPDLLPLAQFPHPDPHPRPHPQSQFLDLLYQN